VVDNNCAAPVGAVVERVTAVPDVAIEPTGGKSAVTKVAPNVTNPDAATVTLVNVPGVMLPGNKILCQDAAVVEVVTKAWPEPAGAVVLITTFEGMAAI
jgi:hypothetical protein